MCGIFGIALSGRSQVTSNDIEEILRNLFVLAETRGKEAAGLAIRSSAAIDVYKRPVRASKMIREDAYKAFIAQALGQLGRDDNGKINEPIVAIGHSRLVTNGTQTQTDNNQPIIGNRSIAIHNGIIVNDAEIWKRHPDLESTTEVDSEVIVRLFDKFSRDQGFGAAATVSVFGEIEGAASVAVLSNDVDRLVLATNTGSLHTASDEAAGFRLFASERFIIQRMISKRIVGASRPVPTVRHVPASNGIVIDMQTLDETVFRFADVEIDSAANVPQDATEAPAQVVQHPVHEGGLTRCSRCILPSTFPLISFDEDGVCSTCRAHEPESLGGRDALEEIVAPYRSGSESPDCIVALSGGRDSSYGLHFLKSELGMNPIAFTYDWGMVTDLARRNQARLCGKLGVEHIIRSPDIAMKRGNIRMNIRAWLHKPDLGLIQLFTAGDKQFFHHARALRRETDIPLVFFCAGHALERTEFKTGFCGIRENQHGMVLWQYSLLNKLKLASYYGRRFLTNPRFWNTSVVDTLWAYWSSYVAKDDFIYLYHYIPWDEDEIMSTLRREYGWETASDTWATWRIGDGTASFYNYVYHTVAGFSEHDTFRSNQVRAGLISRDEALRLAAADNRPRFDAMKEYASLVGFNLDEALMVINAIPKLY